MWRERSVTEAIILHDSHTGPDTKSVVAFLRFRGRQLGLLEVGYHYVIERDARVICTRPHNVQGSHLTTRNHKTIGICLAGGLSGADDFTDDQLWACAQLCNYLRSIYGCDLPILGHKEVPVGRFSSHCPAFSMDAFREDYMGTPMREPPPSLAGPDDTEGLSTQNKLLLEYLRAGNRVTQLVALTNLGLGSLTSRIAELRKLGHDIRDERKLDFHKRAYKSYWLEAADEQPAPAIENGLSQRA